MKRISQARKFAGLTLVAMIAAFSGCAIAPVKSEHAGLVDRLSSGSTGRKFPVQVARGAPPVIASKTSSRIASDELKKIALEWPLRSVEVTSRFGRRGDGVHEGVDLRAKVGTPVYAAQSGTVIHAGGQISGYGKMVVIRHAHGWATIYAHNSKLLVKPGQYVRKGQKIALSGKTGHVTGPHVHFEVRNGLSAYDPVEILGKPGAKPKTRRRLVAGRGDPDELKPRKGPAARFITARKQTR